MKSKCLLIAFPVCIFWLPQAANAGEFDFCSLSFMTYNIKSAINLGSATDGLEKIAQVIEAAGKPDVLMLQEVMRFDPLADNIDEFQWLKDRLGYPYGYFTSGQEDPVPPGTAEWGNAIYLADNTGTVLSQQKYRIGWNRSLCRVTVSVQGATVHFFCTHTGSGAIAEQVQTITGIIEDFTALQQPVILGGDFNANPYNSDMAPLRQILEDVFIVLSSPTALIDTFYISSEVTAHTAASFHDPTSASDHDPTICTLTPWTPLAGPTITQQPQTQDRCPGDTVNFTVEASGNGTLSYQWQLDQPNQQRVDLTDGGRISGATSSSLTISNAGSSDLGIYRCVVTDSDCSRASDDAVLTLTPTAILTHPTSLIVGGGGTAGFSVEAEGAGTLNYQWQKNETNLSDDGRISGSHTANLQITNCDSGDDGSYRCIVSGYCGTGTSDVATLTVIPEPPISFYEDWDNYAEGDDDPAYVARWASITGASRFDVWVGAYDEYSLPNALKVRVQLAMGISHYLGSELTAVVPGADEVRGTDADPLELLAKLYLQYTYLDTADVFAELSKGDVHVTAGNSTIVKPVLAFGLTAGMHGAARYPRFFDGKNWNNVTGITINGGHSDLKMAVKTSSVVLQGQGASVGSATLTRLYTGGFDRLSLRTVYNNDKWRSISDVSLTGGAIKPPLLVSAGPDKQIFLNGSTTLEGSVSGGTPPYTIEWTPTDGLDNPQLLQPTASPATTTSYTLTVTDSLSVSANDSVLVTVTGPEMPCDFDLDSDVDLEDFAVLQNCLGVSNPSQNPTCWMTDLNDSNSITINDVSLFVGCMTGPEIPGDANCPQ